MQTSYLYIRVQRNCMCVHAYTCFDVQKHRILYIIIWWEWDMIILRSIPLSDGRCKDTIWMSALVIIFRNLLNRQRVYNTNSVIQINTNEQQIMCCWKIEWLILTLTQLNVWLHYTDSRFAYKQKHLNKRS